MNTRQMQWAQQHDWFHSASADQRGDWEVWVTENGKLHPWPFRSYTELRVWAGIK